MAKPRKPIAKPETLTTEKLSTPGLTRRLCLVDIAEVPDDPNRCWKVKALATVDEAGNVSSKVVEALIDWRKSNPEDWKRIVKSLKYVAKNAQHHDPSKVETDRSMRGVFEIRANRCFCRLMSFYDNRNDSVVICAFPYSKGSGHHDKDQDAAFAKCARLKEAYEKST